ncbi:MAG: helix-turn-helix transcriptional regulator [Bacillota bacterium]|nr:helix-turn-helix transcriptional regulator [Bacillota bacterium]
MQPYERIRIIRAELGLTQSQLGEGIGLAQSTIGLIENGIRKLTDRVMSDICRVYGINKEWFLTGNGNIRIESPSSVMNQLKIEFNLDNDDYALVYEYLNLNQHDRSVIRNYIRNVVRRMNASDEEQIQRQIDQEVESYRRELEAEAKGKTLSVSAGTVIRKEA